MATTERLTGSSEAPNTRNKARLLDDSEVEELEEEQRRLTDKEKAQ